MLNVCVNIVDEFTDNKLFGDGEPSFFYLVAQPRNKVHLLVKQLWNGLHRHVWFFKFYLELIDVKTSTYLDFTQSFKIDLIVRGEMLYFYWGILLVRVVFEQFFFIVSWPRELPGGQMKQQNPKCERISFQGIDLLLQGLRGHVERAANHVILFYLRFLVGKVAREA